MGNDRTSKPAPASFLPTCIQFSQHLPGAQSSKKQSRVRNGEIGVLIRSEGALRVGMSFRWCTLKHFPVDRVISELDL